MRVRVKTSASSALNVAIFIMAVFTIMSILFVTAGYAEGKGGLLFVGFFLFFVIVYFAYLTVKRPIRLNAVLIKDVELKYNDKTYHELTFLVDDEFAPTYVGGTYTCTLEEDEKLTLNSHYIVNVKEFTHNIESIYLNTEPNFTKQNTVPRTDYRLDNIVINNQLVSMTIYLIGWFVIAILYLIVNVEIIDLSVFISLSLIALIMIEIYHLIVMLKYIEHDQKVIKKLKLKTDNKIKAIHNYSKYKINKVIDKDVLGCYYVIDNDNNLLYRLERLTPLKNNYVISDGDDDIVGNIINKNNKYMVRIKNRKMHTIRMLSKGTLLIDDKYQFSRIYYSKGFKISDKNGKLLCKLKPQDNEKKYAYPGSVKVEMVDGILNNDLIFILSIVGTILKKQ